MTMYYLNRVIVYGLLAITFLLIAGCSAPDDVGRDIQTDVMGTRTSGKINYNIDVSEASSLISMFKDKDEFTLIDARTPAEHATECLKESVNIDYDGANLEDELAKLEKDKTYLVYCRSGRRSAETVKIMQNMGFSTVYNMEGGINEWKDFGGDVIESC